MLQAKRSILVKTALMFALSAYIGLAGKAWALEITLPASIHEILTAEQITTVKADPALKAIQNGMRGGVMTEQAAKRPGAVMFLMSNVAGPAIDNEVSARTRTETITAQMASMPNPISLDGMLDNLAPTPFQ